MTNNLENKRVWFITGASKGLGYTFTCAALKAGDRVVAVARTIDNLAKLKDTYQETLLPLNLDITDRDAVFSTVEAAIEHFGRLDIVVNNSDNSPLRLILGSMVYDIAMDTLKARMATWKEWEAVSRESEKAIPAPEGYGITEEQN